MSGILIFFAAAVTRRVKCLDRVLRTAARLVGRIPRFGRVSGYMRDVLHWLPYPQLGGVVVIDAAIGAHGKSWPRFKPGTLLHCCSDLGQVVNLSLSVA